MAEAKWDYWCPAEGDHVVDPRELCVGIVSELEGGGCVVDLVAAIIPPFPTDTPSQAERFASIIRDALVAETWHDTEHGTGHPNDLPSWLSAHGFRIDWPADV